MRGNNGGGGRAEMPEVVENMAFQGQGQPCFSSCSVTTSWPSANHLAPLNLLSSEKWIQ